MTTRAAIYSRFSTDRQDARSIDDQVRRCRVFAKGHGLEVVTEHADEAQSGASRNRAALQRLLAEARARKFDVVLVDDLSRLSRDLGNTWQIVFGDLAAAGVRVIDCNTGMASDGAGARLTFGAMALVNDTFLQLVKTETHRGLEGRALAGFHTGGRCFGYEIVPEPNPQDPAHPRSLLRVHEPEAETVRRVFKAYAGGMALDELCDEMNRSGLAAPNNARTRPGAQPWSKSVLHVMLRNLRFRGEVVWNKVRMVRDPNTGKRVPRARPESEWIRRPDPTLAIVDAATWAKVQARHKANARGARGALRDRGGRPHLLSGLLLCGVCGSPMVVSAIRMKAGKRYANFACSARRYRGNLACQNNHTIGENKLNRKILAAVRGVFESPEFARWVDETVREKEAKRAKAKTPASQLEHDIRSQEARVEKVTEAVAEVGMSAALRAKLATEEGRLRELRKKLTGLPRKPAPQVAPEAVLAVMREATGSALSDPARARQALAGLIQPVLMKVTPRGYRAEVRPHARTATPGYGSGFVPSTDGGVL
jgi:DNA invertase Pin-like site-specific DNA recombinase